MPVYVKLYLLKKNEKEVFKKKQEWHIRDLKILDGVSNESLDVKMDLGKLYNFIFCFKYIVEIINDCFDFVGDFYDY